jgi:hypothetical protein
VSEPGLHGADVYAVAKVIGGVGVPELVQEEVLAVRSRGADGSSLRSCLLERATPRHRRRDLGSSRFPECMTPQSQERFSECGVDEWPRAPQLP